MADLFDEILKQASNNTKTASRELKKINRSVEQEKRFKAEREAIERKLTKEPIKKNVPPSSVKPNFCIPKLNATKKSEPSVDKDRIAAFLKKKDDEKKKEMFRRKLEKEKLIKLRLETYGGKANKKLAKQFGTTPIDLQQKYGTDREHEEYLKRLQMREEEEADRLCTELRGSVMKALERKKVVDKLAPSAEERKAKGPHRVATNKQNSLRYFTKEDSPGPKSKGKSEAKPSRPSNKMQVLGKSERKKPSVFDFNNLMKKAEAIQKGEPVPLSPPHSSVRRNSIEELTKLKEKSCGKKTDDLVKKSSFRQNGSVVASSKIDKNGKIAEQSSANKYGIGTIKKNAELISKSAVNKARLDKSVSSSTKDLFRKPNNPQFGTKAPSVVKSPGLTPQNNTVPGKRYLPGDIRYKAEANQRPGPSGVPNRSNNNSAVSNRDRVMSVRESRNPARTLLERKRLDDGRTDSELPQKKARLDEEAARARYAEYLRRKRMQQEEMRWRHKEKEEVEDEEYDSDLDSFIDDSEFDELSRKDFEETLRMVNRRYDKSRWAINEKMVDDRYMEANFRDVAREEMRSSKIGLLEDLREAQRGASIAL